MTDLERAREFFANDKYATSTTGIDIDDVAPNYAHCTLKLDDRHRNGLGAVMGGVYYTMADFVFAVSTNTFNAPTVTTTSQIEYLRPLRGDTMIGESECIKDGKTMCFFQVKISDGEGNLVALVNTTGNHLPK